jgi:hypothetical protein
VALVALAVGLLSGCVHGSDCQANEFQCDGDLAENCVAEEDGNGQYYTWRETQCGAGKCKLEQYDAFCALSTDPDPHCDATTTSYCTGTALTECHAGYAASTYDCTSGASTGTPSQTGNPDQKYCVSGGGEAVAGTSVPATQTAFCATEPTPNAVCQAPALSYGGNDASGPACEGNDQLQCRSGYVISRMPCGNLFCEAGGFTFCALSNEPDPGCLPHEPSPSFCEDNGVVQCAWGFRIRKEGCATGTTCHTSPAACSFVSDGDQCTTAFCE